MNSILKRKLKTVFQSLHTHPTPIKAHQLKFKLPSENKDDGSHQQSPRSSEEPESHMEAPRGDMAEEESQGPGVAPEQLKERKGKS